MPVDIIPQAGTDSEQDSAEEKQAPSVEELLRQIKALNKENAKWRTTLRSVEEEREAKAKAEMTELERLKADLAKAEEARTKAEQARLQIAIKSQVIAAAAKANLNDPEDAYRMLDPATLDVDDSGRVSGLDEAIKELLKGKPYLLKQTSNTYSPTNPAGGPGKQSDREILNEIYGGRKANIWGGEGGGVYWNPTITE